MTETWEELAATEMRLQLMSELLKIKVGFADVEEFNLGLKGNLRNKNLNKINEMQDKKIVMVAMEIKMRDEQTTKSKLMRARNKKRAELARTQRDTEI